MEKNSNKSSLWVVLGIILGIAAMAAATYAVVRVIGKKKAAKALDEAEELPELDAAEAEAEVDAAEVTE